MKSRIAPTILFVILFCIGNAQQVIPNGGFETWVSTSTPTSWATYESIIPPLAGSGLASKDSIDKFQGTASVKITSQYIALAQDTIPGVVSLGTGYFDGQQPHFYGVPFTSRPDTLFFAYKYVPVGNDTAAAQILLHKVTGGYCLSGAFLLTGTNGQWVNAGIPLTAFYSDTTSAVDTLLLQFMSSYIQNAPNRVGSTMHVDAVRFGYHPQQITVNLGANQTTCSGANVTLNPVVNGGMPAYSYAWSAVGDPLSCNNCQNPTATITQNSTYTVTVTDSNNGSATASVTFTLGTGNYQMSANGPTTFCAGGSVVLNAGSGYSSYQWSDNSTGSTLSVTQGGTYSVTVTNSAGCTFTDSEIVTVTAPTVSNYQITANGPTTFCSGGTVTLNAGNGFSSYHWSNNSTAQTITVSQTASYSVTVLGTDGCTYTDAQSVSTNSTFTGQTVCIVSVDPGSGKNIVVWEKNSGFGIDSFKVYRESSTAGVYQLIRAQQFGLFSTYTDGQSNPQQVSNRYVITTVDACGESPYSASHKTIHLTSNTGINNEVNLIWNTYEGVNFPSFNIYRGSSQSNMQLLTQVAAGTLTYTDLTPPAPPLYYQIEVINPQGCVPTAKNMDYASSLSNIIQLSTLSINEGATDALTLYSYYEESSGGNILHINYTGQPSGDIKIYDIFGNIVYEAVDVATNEIRLPKTLVTGIYVADVVIKDHNSRSKIFIR